MKRFKNKRFSLVLILFFSLIISSFAQQTATSISAIFTPDPDAVRLNKAGSLTSAEFMYYAFRFSDVNKENTELFLKRYEEIARNLSLHFERNNINPADSYEKGEAILLFLHDNILKRYVEMETRQNELFDRGNFNCVSSSIIYYALAKQNNLDVRAIKTKMHAFCAVIINSKIIDVETTNRFGFDPGEKKEFITAFGNTGFAYVPQSNYRDRHEISAKELLVLILQNKIAEMQRRGNFIDTVPIAVSRNAALGTSDSFTDMINEFKNHAIQLSSRGDSKNAIIFLSEAASVYGYDPVLTDTASKLFNNQIVQHLDRNQTALAMDFYRFFESSPIIIPAMRQDIFTLLIQKELQLFAQNNVFGQSRSKILEYHAQNWINNTDKNNFLLFIYSKEIVRLSNNNEWINALSIARQGVEETEKDSRMVRIEENLKNNIAVVYHNRFATFFNRGDRNSAAAVLEEGLRIVPDSDVLRTAQERLRRQ